ncbi:MAG: 4-hydroxy-tetrahydrodipicolinate synthase [Oscillospiraceae bacterium]|nr:4-hydroxy-tetrahydrodipicolinate synthase [Oscillospiraceae bacterium]
MNKFVAKYGQILCPLITPFDAAQDIDCGVYAQLIEYLEANDLCDSFIVTGTTGEASLLTFDERVQLMKTAVAAAKSKPVIAATGCASTKETIALTREAAKLGIKTVLIVCPFYNKPTQEGLYLHFKAIAEAVPEVDIMLYNIPIFVGVNLEAETVARLAAFPNIVGIKDEAGINPTQVTDFFLATKDIDPDFAIFNGDDIMLLPTIVQGAMGIVSGGAHIFGHEIRAIFKAFEAGDNAKARELFTELYRFCKTTGQNGRILPNSIMRPAIEKVTGIKLGPARLPLAPATEEELAVSFAVLKEIGKI